MDPILRNFLLRTVEWCGLLVAIGLPLCFNPYAEWPFEATKVVFFRWVVALMAVAALSLEVVDRRAHVRFQNQDTQRRRYSYGNVLAIPIAAYGVCYLLSSALSASPYESLWGRENKHGAFTTLSVLAFFMLIEPRLRSRVYSERVVTALLIGSVPVAFYAVVQFVGLDPLMWTTDSISPALSTLGRSNFLGAYLAMVIPFTLYRMATEGNGEYSGDDSNKKSPLASIRMLTSWRITVLWLLQMVCLVLSQARAAWLGLIFAVCLFSVVMSFLYRRRLYLLAPVATLILVLLIHFGVGGFDVTSDGSSNPSSAVTSVSILRKDTLISRMVIWRHTLDLVSERWLLGHGPESFVEVFMSRYPSETLWGRDHIRVTDPHNVVLEHLFSVGVVGLVAWSTILSVFVFTTIGTLRAINDRNEQLFLAAVLSSASAFVVQGQFNPDVIVVTAIFWLSVGMGIGRMACVEEQLE